MTEPHTSTQSGKATVVIDGFFTVNSDQHKGFISFEVELGERQEFDFEQLKPEDVETSDIEIHIDGVRIGHDQMTDMEL